MGKLCSILRRMVTQGHFVGCATHDHRLSVVLIDATGWVGGIPGCDVNGEGLFGRT